MDENQAKALRKPFPTAAIGFKPQPYKKDSPKSACRQCGGFHGQPAAHLEYVGHAATTDRLLQVDPEWSWEPMAYDMGGLPLFDGNRNLWIKLTVCGVTRIGVGDGLGLKECIGDAIRNAAMRFGVALDLWAKEDLTTEDAPNTANETEAPKPPATRTMSRRGDTAAKAASQQAPEQDGWVPPPDASAPEVLAGPPGADGITKPQLTKLHILLTEQGMGEREASLAYISDRLDRVITSSKEITKAEAHRCIESLTAVAEAPFGDEPV